MKRIILAAMLALSGVGLTHADEPRQHLMDIPLDMPLESDLDGEALEGIYQDKLAAILTDSVLIEAPIPHIESSFTENRKLELWFSSREDGRRVFWARLAQSFDAGKETTPEAAIANFEATYGEADIVRDIASGGIESWLLVKIDPRLPEERRAIIRGQVEARLPPKVDAIGDFMFLDMRDRLAVLGPDFRGAILSFTAFDGKVRAQQVELLDMPRAHTVLNLVQ